jgi:thiamine monophosphate kinase
MDYVTINYSLNKTFNVHLDVFHSIIKKAFNEVDDVEMYKDPVVLIIKGGEDLELTIYIKPKSNNNQAENIKELIKTIENYIFDAINSKPNNIQLIIKD